MDITFYHPQDIEVGLAASLADPGFSILETQSGEFRRAYRCFEGKIPNANTDEGRIVPLASFDFMRAHYLIKAAPHIGDGFYNLTATGRCFAYSEMLPRLTEVSLPINLALFVNDVHTRTVQSPSGDLTHILYCALNIGAATQVEVRAFALNKTVRNSERILLIDESAASRSHGWPIATGGS